MHLGMENSNLREKADKLKDENVQLKERLAGLVSQVESLEHKNEKSAQQLMTSSANMDAFNKSKVQLRIILFDA